MKLGKHTLELEYDFSFVLIGISAHEKDYRICWAINNHFGLNLIKVEPLEIKDKKQNDPSLFSLFICDRSDEFLEYIVVANRSEKGLLIPEQKQMDYFFMIRGEVTEELAEDALQKMKETGLVQTAVRINAATLKSKQNLVF